MRTVLVVLFLINGDWVPVEGWGEREAETEEICQRWVEEIHDFLTYIDHKAYCK